MADSVIEMEKLRSILDAKGVGWHDSSDYMFSRTQTDDFVERDGQLLHVLSAVAGTFAMGHGSGLEVWIGSRDEPEWFETAEEAVREAGL